MKNINFIRSEVLVIIIGCFVFIFFTMSFFTFKPNIAYMGTPIIPTSFVKSANAYHLDYSSWDKNLGSTNISNNVHKLVPHNISYINRTSPGDLYDNFEGGTYTLSDGQTSPNGKWQNQFTGYGFTGVAKDPTTGNNYFYEEPRTSTSSHETHASLVTTTKKYSNFDMTLNMNTVKQLRHGSLPNSWETGWVSWHYTDDFHSYAFYLKPTGFQIEKKDNNKHDDSAEIYLQEGNTPKLEFGQWAKVRISMVGTHIKVWVNGTSIADFYDNIPNSPQMSNGAMGLYNEDSSVRFDNVYITPIG